MKHVWLFMILFMFEVWVNMEDFLLIKWWYVFYLLIFNFSAVWWMKIEKSADQYFHWQIYSLPCSFVLRIYKTKSMSSSRVYQRVVLDVWTDRGGWWLRGCIKLHSQGITLHWSAAWKPWFRVSCYSITTNLTTK